MTAGAAGRLRLHRHASPAPPTTRIGRLAGISFLDRSTGTSYVAMKAAFRRTRFPAL